MLNKAMSLWVAKPLFWIAPLPTGIKKRIQILSQKLFWVLLISKVSFAVSSYSINQKLSLGNSRRLHLVAITHISKTKDFRIEIEQYP